MQAVNSRSRDWAISRSACTSGHRSRHAAIARRDRAQHQPHRRIEPARAHHHLPAAERAANSATSAAGSPTATRQWARMPEAAITSSRPARLHPLVAMQRVQRLARADAAPPRQRRLHAQQMHLQPGRAPPARPDARSPPRAEGESSVGSSTASGAFTAGPPAPDQPPARAAPGAPRRCPLPPPAPPAPAAHTAPAGARPPRSSPAPPDRC